MSASITARSPLLVVLYEGAGAMPLEADARFEIVRTLLEKGYRVITTRAGRSGTTPGERQVLVLGRFTGAPPDEAVAGTGAAVHFRSLDGIEPAGVVALVEGVGGDAQTQKPGGWKPWFPVIDYSRCTNCMQCLSFCLFDVYGVSKDKQIEVQKQTNCKTDCPACSRVCPEVAILFPKDKAGPINGDEVNTADLEREKMKIDISALLGGDIYAALRQRSAHASSRFARERDDQRALEERKRCLTKLQQALDIPAEVMNALPTADAIRAKADRAGEGPGVRETAALLGLGRRMVTGTDARLLWKFGWNFGYKGMRSVQRFKKRLAKGQYFPPFLYISIINSCNLRCQGCWVKVDGPREYIPADKLDRLITDAKRQGNSFFGILGGEPFMHPELLTVLERHPDCYFQIFTNGQLITDAIAARLRVLGNATPLVSIEGTEVVSDERRGQAKVLARTLAGLDACIRHKLITGVATSVCQTNIDDLLQESWLRALIDRGVTYAWYHTYRPVGANQSAELALTPEQVLRVRGFVVEMRTKLPLGLIDAYWDDQGQALCPMATGISHHINPWGDIEPCPIIQFSKESIYDERDLFDVFNDSAYIRDFRELAAQTTRGCIVLERPDLVKALVEKHAASDTTHREPGAGLAELGAMTRRHSQHNPGHEIPEANWAYRFAKKHWFFGFGAYS